MKEEQQQIATALIGESGEIDVWGLPVFRVYATEENECRIVEKKKEVESAISESIQYVDKSKRTFVLLLVEVVPMSQKRSRSGATPRRRKTQGNAHQERSGATPRKVNSPTANVRERRRRRSGGAR